MKKYLFIPLLLAVTIGLTSCGVGYHSYDFLSGGGYKDMMITSHEAKITYRGNELNTNEQLNEYVMKRAAELAKEKGFKSFEVVSYNAYKVPDFRPGIAAHTVQVPAAEAIVRFVN